MKGNNKIMEIRKVLILFVTVFMILSDIQNVYATNIETGSSTSEATDAKKKIELNYQDLYMPVGRSIKFKLNNAKGKVYWSSSAVKIAKITSNGKVTAKKIGKAIISAKNNGKTYKTTITIQAKNTYVKTFCKQWVKDIRKNKNLDAYDKVLSASYFVMTHFNYGNYYNAEDLLVTGKGTCRAGSDLVAKLCQKMGFKAKVRFAAKDRMSRYPAGIMFASQHYNVEVIIKGKKYYVDGMPESMTLYMSSSTKPLYFAHWLLGSYMEEYDKLPKKS